MVKLLGQSRDVAPLFVPEIKLLSIVDPFNPKIRYVSLRVGNLQPPPSSVLAAHTELAVAQVPVPLFALATKSFGATLLSATVVDSADELTPELPLREVINTPTLPYV